LYSIYQGEALSAENSTMFEAIPPLPAVVEADQKTLFVVSITNTETGAARISPISALLMFI